MTSPLLDVESLRVEYPSRRSLSDVLHRRTPAGVLAVDGVSLSVSPGELVALVGESGCGKTTTAMTVAGLVHRSGGVVRVEGTDLESLDAAQRRERRKRVQLVFQDPYESLDPRFTVDRLVREPLEVHRVEGDHAALVRSALERVGLQPAEQFVHRYPHQLSGGQRQRVAIAAALVLQPTLLVADEPVSMLDTSVRAGVLELLGRLRSEGMGILMITHDLSTAARYADRICVMYLGRVVEEGPAAEVVSQPQHPYTRALVAAVPRSDGGRRDHSLMPSGETPDPSNIPAGCRFHPRCPLAANGEAERLGIVDRCRGTDVALWPEVGHHRAACHAVSSN
ncbi:MAG: ABC transporter ATP-binding protein [Acidobacteria bacterium]|nr:ABC transporter ATP-binding protein [Acidobacteriota bacterium]